MDLTKGFMESKLVPIGLFTLIRKPARIGFRPHCKSFALG